MVSIDEQVAAASLTPRYLMRHREWQGSAEELHALPMPTTGDSPELWVMRPNRPALVMGSSQRPDLFDLDALAADQIELASRRSGGGAVFIDPHSTVWIDLLAPGSTRWWSRELAENFMMVGRTWQAALASLGVDTAIGEQSPTREPASTLACWAGVGWGELTIDGTKVVGLSQRRTRWGARVQAMAVLDDSAIRAADYLAASDRELLRSALPTSRVAALAATLAAAQITPGALETAVLAAFAS